MKGRYAIFRVFRFSKNRSEELYMTTIEKSITVKKPVTTVYNQWTQFESFPRFMEGVEEIAQIWDRRQRWQTNIGGKKEQFDAEITEQIPDKRIAWHSISGRRHGGVVTFHSLTPSETRIMLQMEYQPEGPTEHVGNILGVVSRRVKGDLRRFKEFIESQVSETGAWRGEIRHD
jgi:uncharacterized membrane protein